MTNDEMTHTTVNGQSRWVTGGAGVRLHVREWGNPDGPPVLLIHGWSQSSLCWSPQVHSALARDLRFVTMDLRGHGMSDKPLDAEHYVDGQRWADDVAAVIDQLRLHRPVLVGWSYGGYVVTDYLRAYGDAAIAGINLVAGAVVLNATFDHIGSGLLENVPGACGPDLALAIVAMRRFLRACIARPVDEDAWETTLCSNMVVPPEVRAALFSRDIDAEDVLSRLTVPLLVTQGTSDDIVLPSMSERTLSACGTATGSSYDDVGHMPFLEDADRFNRELGDFVRSAHSSSPTDHRATPAASR